MFVDSTAGQPAKPCPTCGHCPTCGTRKPTTFVWPPYSPPWGSGTAGPYPRPGTTFN